MYIKSYITAHAAAKLLISDEIDLLTAFTKKETKEILDELLTMDMSEILAVIDSESIDVTADAKHIPQFGKIETIISIPCKMYEHKNNNLDYAQLGLFLKEDPKASLNANIKYGENHGKMAAMTGLMNNMSGHIVYSSLTETFVTLYDEEKQREIIRRLFFRIPIIKILLKLARDGEVNGFLPMKELTESTRVRRGSSVRAILSDLKEINSEILNDRINNIVWK